MMEDLDRYVTIAQAATRLCMGRSTAFKLAKEGNFPVPVHVVAGKQVVSLRRLVEHINGAPLEVAS